MLKLSSSDVQRYVTGQATSTDLAGTYHCGPATVLRVLRQHGVLIRARGRRRGVRGYGKSKLGLNSSDVHRYVTGQATSTDIARTYNCSPSTVIRFLRMNGVVIRPTGSRIGGHSSNVTIPNNLFEDYVRGDKTIYQIANELDLSVNVVYGALRRAGIDTSRHRYRHAARNEEMIAEYLMGTTIVQLAIKYKLSRQRVHSIIQSRDIR